MATSEADIAAQLIERLLADPEFRAQFRRDPATACRDAGLDGLADEMSLGAGKAMMTLDARESKSSLAGVMMAAAMEGVAVYQFGEHVLPALADVPAEVSDVLSRVNLPAIALPELALQGALAGSPETVETPPEPEGAEEEAAEAGAAAAGGGGAAAAAAAPPPAVPPEAAAGGGKEAAEAAAEKNGAARRPSRPPPRRPRPRSPPRRIPRPSRRRRRRTPSPRSSRTRRTSRARPTCPTPAWRRRRSRRSDRTAPRRRHEHDHDHGRGGAGVSPAGGRRDTGRAAGRSRAGRWWRRRRRGAGAAGQQEPGPRRRRADGHPRRRRRPADDRAAGPAHRQEHKIELSVIKTGHDQFTSGGSVSNHFVGRGIDIARVDGEIVNPGSPAARELATEIAEMTGDLRPTEVGTPWAIDAEGFFTDGAHQDHLHVAFDDEPPAGFQGPGRRRRRRRGRREPPSRAAEAERQGRRLRHASWPSRPRRRRRPSRPTRARSWPSRSAPRRRPPWPRRARGARAPGDFSGVADAYPGDDAPKEAIAAWMAKQARGARAAAGAAGDGRAGGVGPEEPQLRPRRLGRVLPDARRASGTRASTPATPTSPSCR